MRSDIRIRINPAFDKIAQLFKYQCTNGDQASSLLPEGVTACGQFIGSTARKIKQRGLHGTAAALRVLADEGKEPELVKELVGYVANRESVEKKINTPSEYIEILARCRIDAMNVTKLGEILYALSFVQTATCPTEKLRKEIIEKLDKSKIRNEGWGYFLDSKDIDLLPTAYAIRGLFREADVGGPKEFIYERLSQSVKDTGSPVAINPIEQVLCLFTLAFTHTDKERYTQSDLYKIFKGIDRVADFLLSQDIEQNVEYFNGSETFYVRVPWQLYLIALTAHFSPFRFASSSTQNRLKQIIKAVEGDGFTYPYSGKFISSRTNAILYDSLKLVVSEAHSHWHTLYSAIDGLRNAVGAQWIKYAAGIIAAIIILWSIYQWSEEKANFHELAPHFVSALLVWIVTLGKER